jgi:hypothetical protein
LALAAFDLARGPDGCWWMLSQRTEAPSGLGYLLENRLLISRQFPQAFETMPVQRLADAYRGLVDGLKQRSPAGADAHIALLTPGPYNETYFEHAYLARYLGLTLVQGGDLLVRHQKLYLKTLQGLQRVHGLLKRVDDAWLDPLELRAESTLGVPGLLQVVRAGNVLLANAPGSGFLESSALLGFMPAKSCAYRPFQAGGAASAAPCSRCCRAWATASSNPATRRFRAAPVLSLSWGARCHSASATNGRVAFFATARRTRCRRFCRFHTRRCGRPTRQRRPLARAR